MLLHHRSSKIVAVLGIVSISTFGAASANASTAARVTICYNRSNGVVHFSASGRCARSQTAVVIGRGASGSRGLIGPRGALGLHGAMGPQGPMSAAGNDGVDGDDGGLGPQGPQGPQGPEGPQGPTGGSGFAGATGGSGSIGATGGSGVAGGTGPQGAPGVNAFHRVVSAPGTNPSGGTVQATCSAGAVAIGGGFSSGGTPITASIPDVAGNSWDVNYSGGGTPNVTAYAICATGSIS